MGYAVSTMLPHISGDDIATVIEAADTLKAIAVLLLLGSFALTWKYGREILQLARALHEKTEKINKGLETNHGSENMGQAVDRLYEMVLDLQVTRDIDSKRAQERHERLVKTLSSVQNAFYDYKTEMEPMVEFGRERMEVLLNERLDADE